MLPTVAIIGRTNVGKSTLFNRITRTRRAIVANEPGVTRDRMFGRAVHYDKPFYVIDTGGFEDPHGEFLKEAMLDQTELGIQEADVIVLLVDGMAGLIPADREVAVRLRRSGKPVFLAVNKIDQPRLADARLAEFYSLGFEKVYPISAEHGVGVHDFLDDLTEPFPEVEREEVDSHYEAVAYEIDDEEGEFGEEEFFEEEWQEKEASAIEAQKQEERNKHPLRVAIVGRPNVGKSSLVNRLLGYDRMVVADIAGTTRDAVDTEVEYEGNKFVLVDTAGVRRKSRVSDRLEKFSVMKAFRAIEECHVAVLVLDATQGIHDQDARIAGMIVKEGRGMVVVFNKWDLPEGREQRIKELTRELHEKLKFLPDPPVVFISALTGQRASKVWELAQEVGAENSKRIPTSEFNSLLMAAVERHKPPIHMNREVKFYFAAQVGVRPPTFAMQTNHPEAIHFSYARFLENFIRKNYGFQGAPIRLKFRKRGRRNR